ncbi:MAG TPA: Gfo/Idh/MocA family oxidoreductase [Asanoa sp.]|jgi:predicted dehydrogenase
MTRWGILATGGIAGRFADDLHRTPGAELVAVGSRSVRSARAFADKHGIPRAYGSWDALAADADLDVVYVATPHAGHHAAASTLLRGGRAVLCEKPITLDRASAAELVDTARAAGLFLMEGMWTRCNPAVRRVQALLDDGAIGAVTTLSADFGAAGPFPPEHRMRAKALGGGALLDLGVYPVALAHLLLGVPDEVRAWSRLGPEGTDENTGIIFGYARGALAALTCGIVGETPNRATVTGQTGRIELERFFAPTRYILARDGHDHLVVDLPDEGFRHEIEEVQRCLDAGLLESPLVPHAATLEVMGLLDAIREQVGLVYAESGRATR